MEKKKPSVSSLVLPSSIFTHYYSSKTKMLGITFSFDRSMQNNCGVLFCFFLPKIYFLEEGIKPPVNITIKPIRSSDNAEVSDSVANTHTRNYQALKMPF